MSTYISTVLLLLLQVFWAHALTTCTATNKKQDRWGEDTRRDYSLEPVRAVIEDAPTLRCTHRRINSATENHACSARSLYLLEDTGSRISRGEGTTKCEETKLFFLLLLQLLPSLLPVNDVSFPETLLTPVFFPLSLSSISITVGNGRNCRCWMTENIR